MNKVIIISSLAKQVLEYVYPKYKYLARDQDDFDGLQAYEEEPEKENHFDGAWDTNGGDYSSLRFIQDELPFVKWSDKKAWRIKEDILDVAKVEVKENPPLKFEKLKEGTWVWDNYYKIYVRVTETLTLKTLNSNDETFIVRVAILTPSLDVTLMSVVYDKYRFYKYEVEDNA